MNKEIKYEIDELLTPEQVCNEIDSVFVGDIGIVIAREVYQPLLAVIKDLDRRLKELEK